MTISANLCSLVLQQLVGGACQAVGVTPGDSAVAGVVGFLTNHFIDNSQRLTEALEDTNQQAWRALEIALAGDSLWDRMKLALASSEERAFRQQVKPFLDACPLAELQGRAEFRKNCLRELQAARKAKHLEAGALDPAALARSAGAFARFADATSVLAAEFDALNQMADELRRLGYANLAEFISLRPEQGQPLLVIAARYFFRRAVEQDTALFQGLAFSQMEKLQQGQEAAFDGLRQALAEQAGRIEEALGSVVVAVEATHAVVLDLHAEQHRQGLQHVEIYRAVLDLQGRLDLVHQELRPRDSLSIRDDRERTLVKQLVTRYRELPEARRQELPALLNAIGKLEVAAGDFQAAQADFRSVAVLVADPTAQAEAHANAYRAALERRDWETALAELQEAIRLDRRRFALFPVDKFQVKRILGAGGFGVAFLCRHRYLAADVVVKTLQTDDLDRGVDTVFAEAQALRQLDHAAIIRLQDCGFASDEDASRPYLVMDYFEGVTLDEATRERPLAADDLLTVACQVASGLHAAHARGILHRDVKPANLLVRRPAGESGWQTKLIDFGLALRRTGTDTMRATHQTLVGSSIAGTLDYAAPEQMGKLPGTSVGPPADVYGFARTCCFALFQTPQPLLRHWRSIPDALAELLESCLEERPDRRPPNFEPILQRLGELVRPAPKPAVVPKPPTTRRSAKAAPAVPLPVAPAPGTEVVPVEGLTPDQRRAELEALARRVAGCTRCSILAETRSNTVFGEGPLDPDIMFISEAPGGDEDRTGTPFVGAAGQVLNDLLAYAGIPRPEVYITNVLKCLHGFTMVLTEDGWQQIQTIVSRKYQGKVAAVDDAGRLVWANINGYFRSPLGGRKLVKLSLHHSRKCHNPAHRTGGVFTDDHEVLTQHGYKPIRDLDPLSDRIHSGTDQPSPEIHQALLGMLLGDGRIATIDNTFRCGHGERQRDYVYHKAKLLGVPDSKVKPYTVFNRKTKKYYKALHFWGAASPYIRWLGQRFYPAGRKVIPADVLGDFSVISLAYLFLDDGHLRLRPNKAPLAEIATCCFEEQEIRLLLAAIAKLGIRGYLRPNDPKRRIHFDVENTASLSRLIAPYVLESLNHKLLPEHRAIPKTILEYGVAPYYDSFDVTTPPVTYTKLCRTVYCLGVEQFENFITHAGVVHNCRPPNNRQPQPAEMTNCREYLDRQIELVRPKFICTLGGCASQNLLNTTATIGRLRGKFHDFRGIPVLCTYHPAFLLPGRGPEKRHEVQEDLKLLLRRLGRPVPSA
jgi:uracil-DNA glycosylase family 4